MNLDHCLMGLLVALLLPSIGFGLSVMSMGMRRPYHPPDYPPGYKNRRIKKQAHK